MEERKGIITGSGNPLTLLGTGLKVGDKAPDAVVIDNDMNPVNLSSFKGKIVVLTTVPSLDTAVCDLEGRRFNDEAGKLGNDVQILTISMDLPFAQKRWCGAAGIEDLKVMSDHRDAEVGLNYGVLIKELRLLARTVFVIDREGIIRYI
ncbi:MAG TPA: thiol peroxidase, partial [Firmicutes bacterium]|nr:thiol peroxidase [Bacillota bacterium]